MEEKLYTFEELKAVVKIAVKTTLEELGIIKTEDPEGRIYSEE